MSERSDGFKVSRVCPRCSPWICRCMDNLAPSAVEAKGDFSMKDIYDVSKPSINYGRKVEVEELKLLTPEQSAKQFAEMFGHCKPEPPAREWWIAEKCSRGNYNHTTDFDPEDSDAIHVIEHSAYQNLERQVCDLKFSLDEAHAKIQEYSQLIRDKGIR